MQAPAYTARMKSRSFDPTRLDVAALATDGQALSGTWPGADLPRLAQSQSLPQDMPPESVEWRAHGERVAVAGSNAQLWLRLAASTRVWLTCQRCLQPYAIGLGVEQRVRFVRDEATAEALDAEVEEDVLALPRRLNLRDLAEDELLLSLPLVPRHETCPQPLIPGVDSLGNGLIDPQAAEAVAQPVNPFAVLKALKSGGSPPQ